MGVPAESLLHHRVALQDSIKINRKSTGNQENIKVDTDEGREHQYKCKHKSHLQRRVVNHRDRARLQFLSFLLESQ